MKNTFQIYFEAKYQPETLESLAWLESSSENLGNLLESYRYLQPDGELFSAQSIEKIHKLVDLSCSIAKHMEECHYHEKMIEHYEYEIHCIENGLSIMHQDSAISF